MRHRRSTPKLGVKTAHRKAMLSNMATSLLESGQIETTVTRAKALVPEVSRLITLAKKDDVHRRRVAATKIKNQAILKKLFEEVAPEFKNRNGGYLRIIKSGFRKGDGASMAIVQLLLEKKAEEEKDKDKDKDKDKKTITAKSKTKAATKKVSKEKSAQE